MAAYSGHYYVAVLIMPYPRLLACVDVVRARTRATACVRASSTITFLYTANMV